MSKEICFIYNSKKMHFRYVLAIHLYLLGNIPCSVMFDNMYIYVYTLYMSNIFFIRKTRLVGDLAVLVLSVFFYGAYSGLGSSL